MCAVCMQETDPEKIKRSLAIIYRSGDLLHNLLTDLLTFSKNQVGQQLTLDEKRFRLKDVETQLKAIFDAQATENKLRSQFDQRIAPLKANWSFTSSVSNVTPPPPRLSQIPNQKTKSKFRFSFLEFHWKSSRLVSVP